jgi:hypothetical protein
MPSCSYHHTIIQAMNIIAMQGSKICSGCEHAEKKQLKHRSDPKRQIPKRTALSQDMRMGYTIS